MRTPWWLVDIGMYTSSDILMEFITSVRPRKAILTHCCFLEICIVSPVCTYERQIHIRYWHVAQLDRAQRYGRWCCRFDSCRVSFPIYLSWQRVITARITLDESRWFESSYRNCILYKKCIQRDIAKRLRHGTLTAAFHWFDSNYPCRRIEKFGLSHQVHALKIGGSNPPSAIFSRFHFYFSYSISHW